MNIRPALLLSSSFILSFSLLSASLKASEMMIRKEEPKPSQSSSSPSADESILVELSYRLSLLLFIKAIQKILKEKERSKAKALLKHLILLLALLPQHQQPLQHRLPPLY